MVRKKLVAGIITMFLVIATVGQISANATEINPSRTLSLEQARQLALSASSPIEVAKIDVEKAKAKLEWAEETAEAIDSEQVYTYEKGKTKIYGPAQAKSELVVSEEKLKQTQAQGKIAVDQAYYGLLKSRKLVESFKAADKRANEQLKLLNAKYKAGSVAKNELIEAEVQAANAKSSLVDGENDEKIALLKLNQTLGLELNTELILTKQIKYTPPPQIKLDEEIQIALAKRVDILQARETLNLKQVENQLTNGYYGPGVYIYEESRYSLLQAQSTLKDKLKLAEVSVQTAYFNLLSLDQRYNLAEKSLLQAKEALRIAQKRYQAGLARSTEVSSAIVTLSQAESKSVEVLVQYSLAQEQFSFELGKYEEEM